ncbi:hypothetical protein [Sandaracinus amylolyticus]|uniref:hypothetical protein n=1 Tax=Sandaracinus amylolyticus TaxID=927083 RepID=UPI001F165FCD|nr:hypothetical protein [Sandaracinus amylolyticus]UJR83423.1 Hypothetical protein I5071_54910 [Sandaracinus amylolyticus]
MGTRFCAAGAVVVATFMASGCAHTAGTVAGEVAEEMPEPLIESTLDELRDEDTRRAFVEVLSNPEVQEATRALIANVTDGTLDALSDEERAARIADVSNRFVASVSDALAGSLERDIGPALAQTMSRALDASLRRILDEESTQRIAAAVSRVAQESAVALAVAMREEIGPAMRAALTDAMHDPEAQRAIAVTMRTLSREVVLGVQDAFEEIEARDRAQRPDTPLTRIQDWAEEGAGTLQIVLVVAVLALLALVAWQVHTTARARAQEAQAQRREAAIVALTEALRNAQSRPESAQLLESLERAFGRRRGREFLRELLERSRRGPGGGPGGPLEPAGT